MHPEISDDLGPAVNRATHEAADGGSLRRPGSLTPLTFDDGPYPIYTPMLLDVLHDLHYPRRFS